MALYLQTLYGAGDRQRRAQPPEPSEQRRESLTVIGVSGLEGVGQILERPRGGAPTLVVRARLTLVLNTHSPLPNLNSGQWNPGDWISFTTEPLLHGFTLSGSAR